MSEQKDRWTLLAETARELNKVLGLEPEIPTTDVSEAELEEKLEEAAALVASEDEFTDQTAYILSEFTEVVDVPEDFEIEIEEPEEEVEAETEELEVEEANEVDDAEEAEEAEEEEYTLAEIREFVETTDKRKDLRVFAEEFPDVFEDSIDKMYDGGLRSSEELKESMLADLDDTEAEEAEEDFEEEAGEQEAEEPEIEEPESEEESDQEKDPESEEEEADKSEEQKSESKEKTDESDKSAMYYVRRFTCENPEITTGELMEKLKEIGFDDPNRSSVSIRKNEMQHAVTIMDELGKLK